MELTKRERYFKVFEKYMDGMKGRSVKWFVPGFSGYHDHKIRKFMRFYAIPINYEDIIMFLDTTVFRSAKEGFLFTTDGILIKEVMEKLYYLKFSEIEDAQLEEITDDIGVVTSKIRINFKDGTSRNVLDYDVRKYAFVEYVNEALALTARIAREKERGM